MAAAAVGAGLDRTQRGDGYVLLDSHRVRPVDLRHDNAAALLAGLENPLPSTTCCCGCRHGTTRRRCGREPTRSTFGAISRHEAPAANATPADTTSIQHEQPSRQLAQMAGQFAMVRGSRIACYGSGDLVRRDDTGRKRWLMRTDEVLYLRPDRVRLEGPAIEVGADPLPEMVLEVDHTTDVRRRKLRICMESGFPEIRVLVPWEASVGAPGLAIHVRRGDVYREEASSRAFPGWRAEEIFRALTEAPMSEVASSTS